MDCCPRILCRITFQVLLVLGLGSLAGCASGDLEQRVAMLKEQTAQLEQIAQKLETENANHYTKVRESLNAEDVRNKADRDQLRSEVNNRLDEINRQMELLQKDIIDAVQKTNAALVKSVDARLDSLDVVIGTILLRIEELEKRPQPSKK
jgi:predicted  nucleic acid-binding Zn-ribbon protein